MKRCIAKFAIILLYIMMHSINVQAYDNEVTHREITRRAVAKSILEKSITDYLYRSLGIEYGITSMLNGRQIEEWLRDGSYLEDIPNCRAANHFHNPLKPWNLSYMTDGTVGPAALSLYWCEQIGWRYVDRKSAITWATGYLSAPPSGQKAPFSKNPALAPINWDKARENFYKALTLKDQKDRDINLSQTFSAVGQVMHLLQDMAVPAHTRNDFQSHFIENENKSTYDYTTWYKQPYEYYVQANSQLIGLTAPIKPVFPNAKLTDFWDTDKYNGSNQSTLIDIGLAEFSNANYFSDYTLNPNNATSAEHTFPYPYIKDSGIQGGYKVCTDISVGSDYNPLYPFRKYISRKTKGDICPQGIPAISEIGKTDHFAVVSLLAEPNIGSVSISSLRLTLDNNVHNTYAKELIPRAVGYSAALLDYFFRGDIRLDYETTPTPGYVFVNKTGERFDGSFKIYYDNKRGQRHIVWDGTGYLEAKMNDKTNIIDLKHPVDAKEPGRYILVSKGNMGNEKGAVAGYVTSRLLEITPPDQFIYSMVDAGSAKPQFTNIKVKIKNASNEPMQNGTLQAIAKYKKTTDDPEFLFSVSTPQPGISLGSTAQEFSFDFTNPIPVDATDLYLEIVFKGTIGTEQGATAIGIKDISEPTPIDLFNNTDRSCLNSKWYVSGSPAAIARVDKDNDGNANDWNEWDVYPHILKNLYIKISSPANPQTASPSVNNFVLPDLDAGQFRRTIYILTDDQFKYSINTVWERKGSDDLWGHSTMTYLHSGTAVKNQTDYISDPAVCGSDILCYTPVYPADHFVRGFNMWWGGGIVFISSPYPAASSCQGYE